MAFFLGEGGSTNSAGLRPQEEWYRMPVPAAVSDEVWEAAQHRLGQNKVMAYRSSKIALVELAFPGAETP
ncbi:MAG: hypothetical protein QGI09_09505 [Dehalococcoidia bacterium]|nr:hypothetical protein [Dehalococcoidia bacterium]